MPPLVSFDETFKLVKVSPLAAWTKQMCRNTLPTTTCWLIRVPEGYPSIGCAVQPNPPEDSTRGGRWQSWPRPNAGCASLTAGDDAERSDAIKHRRRRCRARRCGGGTLRCGGERHHRASARPHRTRQQRSAVGYNARAIAGGYGAAGSTCGSRSVAQLAQPGRRVSRCRGAAVVTRCCWPMPTMLASTSLPRSPAAALVTRYARPVCGDIRLVSALRRHLRLRVSPFDHTLRGGRAHDQLIASRGQIRAPRRWRQRLAEGPSGPR